MELESVQIPNFLSENRADKLLNVYFKACKILGCKIHELRLDGGVVSYITGTKVTEFDYRYCPDNSSKVKNPVAGYDLYEKIPEDEIKEINCDWVPEMIDHLNKEFEKINRNGKIHNFAIFNLPKPIAIHSDGNDLKNKRGKRNVFNPVFKREEYLLDDQKYTHQGLITLQNDDVRNGTIVFDQSFPYSVYYMNNKNDLDRKKSVITFLKDDDIFRFDEKIKNYTHEYMSNEEHKIIPELDREQLFGLSLDKKLMFMDKGNLISWKVGKFHTPIPYMKKGWGDRVMLQYEAVDK